MRTTLYAAALALWAWNPALVLAQEKAKTPDADEAKGCTAKVENGEIKQVVEATGTINAVITVQVGSQVSGVISKLYVDFNSPVKKGQLIAQIDPALFVGAVSQAKADLANAKANLAALSAFTAELPWGCKLFQLTGGTPPDPPEQPALIEIFQRKEYVATIDAARPVDEVYADIRARFALS